jgi:predicted thioesterase
MVHLHDGLQFGMTADVETLVTAAMTATLCGQPIHPVLATARMIEWMEWAGRKLILPYLEEDEDAVGYQIHITHRRPTQAGETLRAYAEFQKIEGSRVFTRVWAENNRERIGDGLFVQVLMKKSQLAHIISAVPPPT